MCVLTISLFKKRLWSSYAAAPSLRRPGAAAPCRGAASSPVQQAPALIDLLQPCRRREQLCLISERRCATIRGAWERLQGRATVAAYGRQGRLTARRGVRGVGRSRTRVCWPRGMCGSACPNWARCGIEACTSWLPSPRSAATKIVFVFSRGA